MIEPPEGDMPKVRRDRRAQLGQTGTCNGDVDDCSDLNVCWFTDEFPIDIVADVGEMTKDLDWDGYARATSRGRAGPAGR